MGDDALGQVVAVDLLSESQRRQLGCKAPVTADDPAEQALVAQVVQTSGLAVTLTRRIDQREVAGGLGLDKSILQGHGHVFREADAHETAGGDHIPIFDAGYGQGRGGHLAPLGQGRSRDRGRRSSRHVSTIG